MTVTLGPLLVDAADPRAVERFWAAALGATVLAEFLPQRVTLADVEGNEFCAFLDRDLDDGLPARAFAVCTDSNRPEELAAWWAHHVGAEVRDGSDSTPPGVLADPQGNEFSVRPPAG